MDGSLHQRDLHARERLFPSTSWRQESAGVEGPMSSCTPPVLMGLTLSSVPRMRVPAGSRATCVASLQMDHASRTHSSQLSSPIRACLSEDMLDTHASTRPHLLGGRRPTSLGGLCAVNPQVVGRGAVLLGAGYFALGRCAVWSLRLGGGTARKVMQASRLGVQLPCIRGVALIS